jgi:hypothetical protein
MMLWIGIGLAAQVHLPVRRLVFPDANAGSLHSLFWSSLGRRSFIPASASLTIQ